MLVVSTAEVFVNALVTYVLNTLAVQNQSSLTHLNVFHQRVHIIHLASGQLINARVPSICHSACYLDILYTVAVEKQCSVTFEARSCVLARRSYILRWA